MASSHSFFFFPAKEKIDSQVYTHADAFVHDVRQLLSNIMKYYSPDHAAVVHAREVETQFERHWAELKTKLH